MSWKTESWAVAEQNRHGYVLVPLDDATLRRVQWEVRHVDSESAITALRNALVRVAVMPSPDGKTR